MKKNEILQKNIDHDLTCSKILFEQNFKEKYYLHKDVNYEILVYKHQRCCTIIEVYRFLAMTYVLEILISAFRPDPGGNCEDATQ